MSEPNWQPISSSIRRPGSGSIGIAAARMGMRFVGIELDPAHFETARTRFAAELSLTS